MKFETEAERRHYEEDYRPAYDALMTCYPFTLDAIPDEVWKPVDGYEDYHVSNYGRVKSFKRKKPRILKPALTNKGYLYVALSLDGKQKHFLVHVLVARAFIPNPDNKPEVNHRIGWKLNCYVGNLEWATHEENMEHAVDTGLRKIKGKEHPLAKIKDEQVLYIRNNPDNLSRKELAAMFGMTETNINAIQTGKLWGHVGGTVREKQKKGWYHRISDEKRVAIRADRATGNFTYEALAKKYNLARSTIWKVLYEV